jgi:chromate transporter
LTFDLQTRPQIGLARFTWIVARDVNRTFGGGLASMELLRRTFTTNGLLDQTGNASLVAVSRLTPGTNILAYCVGLGWSLHRWRGALAALVASSLPASLIICALTAAIVRIDRYPGVRVILAVAVLAATLLVFSSGVSLLRPYVQRSVLTRTLIVAFASGAMFLADITPVRILLLSAALGAAIAGLRRTSDVE